MYVPDAVGVEERKLKETNQLIQDCAGILKVVADQPRLAPGEGVTMLTSWSIVRKPL